MLSLLTWVLIGTLAGLIARGMVPAKQRTRHRQDVRTASMVAASVAGACLGGLASACLWPTWVEWTNNPDANRLWPGWLAAVAGAALLLWGYIAATGRRDNSSPRRPGSGAPTTVP